MAFTGRSYAGVAMATMCAEPGERLSGHPSTRFRRTPERVLTVLDRWTLSRTMCTDAAVSLINAGSRAGGAVHISAMNLSDYMPQALAALDADPDSRLAISLDNLNRADDKHLIGLDLVKSYMRQACLSALTISQNHDIARYRRARDILTGKVRLEDGTSYRNLWINVRDLGGDLLGLESDGEARALIGRLAASEPVLGLLIADRYDQKVRQRRPGYRGGPNLEDHLADIERTLDSDPEGRLAVSLDNLLGKEAGRRLGITQIVDYVRGTDPAGLTGQLAADVTRFRRALGILDEQITLGGLTFFNLQANVRDMMGDLENFVTSTEARDLAARIAGAVPALAEAISAREPEAAFQ